MPADDRGIQIIFNWRYRWMWLESANPSLIFCKNSKANLSVNYFSRPEWFMYCSFVFRMTRFHNPLSFFSCHKWAQVITVTSYKIVPYKWGWVRCCTLQQINDTTGGFKHLFRSFVVMVVVFSSYWKADSLKQPRKGGTIFFLSHIISKLLQYQNFSSL